MNVALIGTNDISGGAARAMYRLHLGLQNINVNSYILSKNKKSADKKVIKINPTFDKKNNPDIEKEKWIQEEYINNGRSELSNTLFTFPYPGYDLSNLEAIQNADIINLHWVAWFQSAENVAKLLSLGKPVVWTLHDMRPFTGGCHYGAGCRKFETDCLDCPQLKNDYLNIPAKTLELQKKMYGSSNITVVTPSSWLAEEAKKSAIFRNVRIETISNGVDLNIFKPTDKYEARKKLGLDGDKKYILFGADSFGATYKGFDLLLDVLGKLRQLVNPDEIIFLIFGGRDARVEELAFSCKNFDIIENDEMLSLIYSAADITVIPSREDNLPNVMLESIACGTPVVGFRIGGLPDIISKNTGALIEPFEIESMALKIADLLRDDQALAKLSLSCSEFAVEKLSIDMQARDYQKLFLSLLDGRQLECSKYLCTNEYSVNRESIIDKSFKGIGIKSI